MGDRRHDAEDHQQRHGRREKIGGGDHHDFAERDHVARALEPPTRGIVEEVNQRSDEPLRARRQHEHHDDQDGGQRSKDRDFAGNRHDAALDGVVKLLFRRFLGLAVGVLIVAHGCVRLGLRRLDAFGRGDFDFVPLRHLEHEIDDLLARLGDFARRRR